MAITIQTNPGTYYSVHGDLLFVVCDIVKASDPDTYQDYKYVLDLYIDGVLVSTTKIYPNPTNKMGIFNIGSVVRDYISPSFSPTYGAFRAQELGDGVFFKKATAKFGEEYNFVLTANITVDSERTYFGHYDGRLLGVLTNLSAKANKLATARAAVTQVYESSKYLFVPAFATVTDVIDYEIRSFTKDGTAINVIGPISVTPSAAGNMQILNLSPININSIYPGAIPAGVAGYYNFYRPTQSSEPLLRFDIVCEPRHEVFTLHFLNRYGGFDSRSFTKLSRKVIDVEKREFGKLGFVMDSSGIVSYKDANNVYEDTKRVYSSSYKEKLVLNTDILTDDEYTWLGDLIISPMIYIEQYDDANAVYFVPCAITESNYEFRKVINDKLTNLTVNVEFGEQFNAQFR